MTQRPTLIRTLLTHKLPHPLLPASTSYPRTKPTAYALLRSHRLQYAPSPTPILSSIHQSLLPVSQRTALKDPDFSDRLALHAERWKTPPLNKVDDERRLSFCLHCTLMPVNEYLIQTGRECFWSAGATRKSAPVREFELLEWDGKTIGKNARNVAAPVA